MHKPSAFQGVDGVTVFYSIVKNVFNGLSYMLQNQKGIPFSGGGGGKSGGA